jgi:phytoene/squalene synthetase
MTISRTHTAAGLDLYSRVAQTSSSKVIRQYSTSFGMAARLLGRRVRPGVESIYGLVRVADEVVDGAASEAGLDLEAQRALLDRLQAETEGALLSGYSTNLIVHSFAATARAGGFGPELTCPFFASMRRDLDPAHFTTEEVRRYIHGSAEVVGLMCLRVFLEGVECDSDRRLRLEHGAQRLGAAFQKINFLRDLRADWSELGRNYLPGIDPDGLTEAQKRVLVADIDSDLDAAAPTIPELPKDCRAAVASAHQLFAALTRRVEATPATELLRTRIRVPNATKLRIVATAKAHSSARSAT